MNYFKKEFFQILVILKEYLSDIVIAGGWAPLIYYHYFLSDKERMPLRTKDIDIVIPGMLEIRGNNPIDELLAEAGFKVRFKSLHVIPAVSYEGKIGDFEVEIEFLTHQKGAGEEQVVKVQDGLQAQSLRYISILLENAVEAIIDDFLFDDGEKLMIRVPSPGSYVFQKGLTFSRRTIEVKKSKDLYYIFDVLSQDLGWTESIASEFTRFKANYPLKWIRRFVRDIKENFQDINSKGVSRVMSQRPDGRLPHLNDDQFRQYVLGVFQDFIGKVESVISA